MVAKVQFCKVSILLLYFFSIPLRAITVGPALCPTNKIAPHRRIYARDNVRGRTFGAFYDLLVPNGPYDPTNDLQETPQPDDPDDCGDIEDYDENDLSSITPQSQRRTEYRKDRFSYRPSRPPASFDGQPSENLFGHPSFLHNRPPHRPPYRPPNRPPYRPPYVPSTKPPYVPTTKPPPMTRPPYWSGGVFGSNGYRPPLQQNPSDSIKPIHEYSEFEQMTYRPDLVGAPLGHIVGASPIRPTTSEDRLITHRPYYPPNRIRYTTPAPDQATRRSRARNLNNNGLFGSFVDLLFK